MTIERNIFYCFINAYHKNSGAINKTDYYFGFHCNNVKFIAKVNLEKKIERVCLKY